MKFQGKYRIESNRLAGWDYAENGIYFLTICVQDRACLFGDVIDGQMHLNQFGKIIYNEWKRSTEIRSEIQLDEFIVMPNHLHGVVILNKPENSDCDRDVIVETHGCASLQTTENVNHQNIGSLYQKVETHGRVSLQKQPNANDIQKNIRPSHAIEETRGRASLPQRKPKSISSFVAGYKSSVTTKINEILVQEHKPLFNRVNRLWQPNYFDRVVRDQNELDRIINYIMSNPENWINDQQNQTGLWQ